MLVLSRKIGEEILVGDNIRITVVQSKGGKVRLGISAPDDVGIRRAEIAPLGVVAPEPARTRLRKVPIVAPQNPILDCPSFI